MNGGPDRDVPDAPERETPPEDWKHRELHSGVREAVFSLPVHFRTGTHISGIMATDLHTLNTVLGATIEEQVVRTLNLTRNIWDPDGRYALYHFVRQAQTFPDVLLRRTAGDEIVLGIELKGWYLLAKEAEPSLRFQVTEDACAPQDLLVVVPWVLDNVISGSPILFEPFVESARFAAAHRNHHWQYVRQTRLDTGIKEPAGIQPYPRKSDSILDRPRSDGGGNFGRLARTGMMDTYMRKLADVQLCGINSVYWRDFLRTFQEGTTDQQARAALDRLRRKVDDTTNLPSPKAQSALAIIQELETILDLSD